MLPWLRCLLKNKKQNIVKSLREIDLVLGKKVRFNEVQKKRKYINGAQCGKFAIFPIFIFSVKSILKLGHFDRFLETRISSFGDFLQFISAEDSKTSKLRAFKIVKIVVFETQNLPQLFSRIRVAGKISNFHTVWRNN